MEPSNTPPRTPPPSHRPVPSSPGSTSMFPQLNNNNNETGRINAGPPKLKSKHSKKSKKSKNNNNDPSNNMPPNRLLTTEELKKRDECKLILTEIQDLHEQNYNCCDAICNDTNIINNTEIINNYLKKLKKYNVKLCNIDVDKTHLEYIYGKPPKLNLPETRTRPFNKRKYSNNNNSNNRTLMPPPKLPINHPKSKSSASSAPSTKKTKLLKKPELHLPLTKKTPVHFQSSQLSQSSQSFQNLLNATNTNNLWSGKFNSSKSPNSPNPGDLQYIANTQEYKENNSQTPPKK